MRAGLCPFSCHRGSREQPKAHRCPGMLGPSPMRFGMKRRWRWLQWDLDSGVKSHHSLERDKGKQQLSFPARSALPHLGSKLQ